MDLLKKIVVLTFLLICLQPLTAVAQTTTLTTTNTFTKGLSGFATKSGYLESQNNNSAIAKTVGRMAAATISFTATIFIIIAIYSGIQWMTAGGAADRVKEARTRLTRSVGGFILITLAYIITTFVVNILGS